MTWTVASGDVVASRYTICNKKMTWFFGVSGTTVGGTPDSYLKIAIPASKTCGANCFGVYYIYTGGASIGGQFTVFSGEAFIRLYKLDQSNWANDGSTTVLGQVTLEIQ